MPTVTSVAELSELIAAGDLVDDSRVITGHSATVGAEFAGEAASLHALPTEAFDPAVTELNRTGQSAAHAPPRSPGQGAKIEASVDRG